HDRARRRASQSAHDAAIEHDRLPREAQTTATHAAFAHQRGGDIRCDVATDGEADSLRAAGDRGIDADDASRAVDERAARVAWIQRRVGLNHAFDESARARPQAATERADDARSHRRLIAERIADRDDELTDAQRR